MLGRTQGAGVLTPSRSDIERFVSYLFRYGDQGSFISLRAFDQKDRGKPPVLIEGVRLEGDHSRVVAQALFAAERAANTSTPSVFAPPVATFTNPTKASSADVANGVAISVELDAGNPRVACRKLEAIIGPVTVVVQSGGEWMDPDTGEFHAKAHLHWRLSEPTRTAEEHSRLQYARLLAAKLVGGDPTATPPAHPLRWPGSWNTKAKPRLARIVGGNEAAEVHLDHAIEQLEEAIEAAGLTIDNASKVSSNPTAQTVLIASALAAMQNQDAHWDEWNRIGMAAYRASNGSQEGLDAWCEWSAKSSKHQDAPCIARWAHYATSPPSRIGAGTIFFQAAQDGWRRPVREQEEPPPVLEDEGYWSALEEERRMSAAQWHDLVQREAGIAIPASPQAKAAAGKDVLWLIEEPWEEHEIDPRPWIVRGYLMRGAVTVVSGPGSAGKSSLMVSWATTMALGSPLDRFKVTAPLKVGVYNVEDDAQEQRRRFSAMAQQFGVSVKAFFRNLFVLGPARVGTLLTMTPEGRMLVNTPVMDKMETWVSETQPDVLILDPFVELHAGEENDNTQIRAVMARFRTMAAEHNMAVVILHHSRKGEAVPGDPDSLRGASAIVGAARVVLTVNVMSDDEARSLNIPSDNRRDYFRLDGAKSNYAPVTEAEWFERKVRTLNNAKDGLPGDGVAVAWPWTPPSVWKDMTPDAIAVALDKIAAGPSPGILYSTNRRGSSSARWVGNPVMNILALNEAQAEKVVKSWLQSGLLYPTNYRDTSTRKDVQGVAVDRSKQP